MASLLAGAGPQATLAHSVPVSSAPYPGADLAKAPSAVTMVFSEPPDPALSAIDVLDPNGASVVAGRLTAVPNAPNALSVELMALPRDLYTVSWRAVSLVDGHLDKGSFVFGVGMQPPQQTRADLPVASLASVPPLAILGHWLLYAGLFALLGAAFVGNLIYSAPPTVTLRLSAMGWLASTVGLLLVVGVQAAGAQIDVSQLLGTSIGRAAVIRAVPLVVAGLAIAIQAASGRQTVRAVGTVGIAAAGALLADAATSHAAASAASQLGAHGSHLDVFVQWAHATAAGTWLGGLLALLLTLPGLPQGEAGRVARRFALSATIGIGVVAFTGVLRAVSELGPIGNLITTDFGRLLIAKSALLVALAGLGGINHFRNVPSASQRVGPIRKIGSLELLVASAVLLLSASLVNVSPPVSASGANAAALAIAPSRPGGAATR